MATIYSGNPANSGGIGVQAAPAALPSVFREQNNEPSVAAGLVQEMEALHRGLYELRARIIRLGDRVVGMRPEDAGKQGPEPNCIYSAISEMTRVMNDCHSELSRTTNALGV